MKDDATTYLGDGLYAKIDNYGTLWLWTLREDVVHEVALEPEVYQHLVSFMKDQTNAD